MKIDNWRDRGNLTSIHVSNCRRQVECAVVISESWSPCAYAVVQRNRWGIIVSGCTFDNYNLYALRVITHQHPTAFQTDSAEKVYSMHAQSIPSPLDSCYDISDVQGNTRMWM